MKARRTKPKDLFREINNDEVLSKPRVDFIVLSKDERLILSDVIYFLMEKIVFEHVASYTSNASARGEVDYVLHEGLLRKVIGGT